jgi:hypothetical protein
MSRKIRTKTSLSITLNPDGSAQTNLKWSDIDAGHPREAAERIIVALTNVPDYNWLFDLVQPLLYQRYCATCPSLTPGKPCEDEVSNPFPFPYCHKEK